MCLLFFSLWGEMFTHWLRFISSLCFDTSSNFLEDRPYKGKGGLVRGLRVVAWTCTVTQNRPAPSQEGAKSGTLGCWLPPWASHSGCCLLEEIWKKRKECYTRYPGKSMFGRGLSQGRFLDFAEHRQGFWNLVSVQKSSLYREAVQY